MGTATEQPVTQPSLAERSAATHQMNGGSTFDPRTGADMSGSSHWTVGMMPESAHHSTRPFTPDDFLSFASGHGDIFMSHPNSAVGTEHDPSTGLHTMEVVGTTPSKTAAMKLGKELGEAKIYHLGRSESVATGHEGERPVIPHSIDERFVQLRDDSPKRQPFSGTHFSDLPLDTIDGNRRGMTGKDGTATGGESARLRAGTTTGMGKDAPPGFYAYADGSLPEPSVGQRKFAHPVRGSFAFATTDHPDFKSAFESGHQMASDQGADDTTARGLGANAGEHALRDAGFDGYHHPSRPDIRFLFGSHQLPKIAKVE